MNILLISSIYPEPREYRIQEDTLVVHYFAKYLVEKGHRVIVLHPSYNRIGNIKHFLRPSSFRIKHNKRDGVDVICGELQLLVPHELKPMEWRSRFLAKRMKKFLKRKFPSFTPNVLAVHFPVVLDSFVSVFDNVPLLAVCHGTDIRIIQKLKQNSRKKIVTKLNRTYKKLAYRSPKLQITSKALGLDDCKSEILITGINRNLLAEKQAIVTKANSITYKKVLNIIFAGKLVKQKRIDAIIKALALLKDSVDYKFNIIGNGPILDELKDLSDKCGISDKVIFHGKKTREEVSAYMSEADVFVMVSTNETLGLVYLEAMAQGCITIGSKSEGIDGVIINEKNGYLVDPYNTKELSDVLKKVYNLPIDEKSKIINTAYNDMLSMTDIAMSNKYLQSLNQIMKNE